jgi:hypothetical protein
MALFVRCLLFLLCAFASSCHQQNSSADQPPISPGSFSNAERVSILGYADDAMEPFITRDGKYLFFNNLNEPRVNTNLHWAERIDDLKFRYKGEIAGVNTSALEGVPSMDRQGDFYFVSTRSYNETPLRFIEANSMRASSHPSSSYLASRLRSLAR